MSICIFCIYCKLFLFRKMFPKKWIPYPIFECESNIVNTENDVTDAENNDDEELEGDSPLDHLLQVLEEEM